MVETTNSLIKFRDTLNDTQLLHLIRMWISFISVHHAQQNLMLNDWAMICERLRIPMSDFDPGRQIELSFYNATVETSNQIATLEAYLNSGRGSEDGG